MFLHEEYMLLNKTDRGIQGHFQGDQVVKEKPGHSVQYVGQEQVLVNRHPSTVELSVIQEFTGVNKKFTVSVNKGYMFTVYNIIQKQVLVNRLPGIVGLSGI